jgi:hypothetical protein
MKRRCYNSMTADYELYGGRGISVCQEWHQFESFAAEMESGYKPGLTLERIDVDGNYCLANCRWATVTEQARNRRTTLWVCFQGKVVSLAQAAECLGVPYKRAWKLLKQGRLTGVKAEVAP